MSLRQWGNGLLCGLICLITPFAAAKAANVYGDKIGFLTYIYYQHSSSPVYDIALQVMAPLYKDVIKIKNPLIGIAEVNLNQDKMLELITKPTEEYEEEGQYCKGDYICPHYITEIRGKKPHSLGIIPAQTVDLGDDIKNGYWRLKAYQKRGDPASIKLYEYSPTKDQYVPSKP